MVDTEFSFIDRKALAALVKRDEADFADGTYGGWIVESVETIIRDEAAQEGWVGVLGDDPAPGLTLAPPRARVIGLWAAKRAFEDQGNIERRTSGPISTTYREGPAATELTAPELDWLHGRRPGGSRGLRVQRVESRRHVPPDIFLPDSIHPAGSPIHMDDGSSAFMYGVDDG